MDTASPLVSILMSSFNAAAYIAQALESALSQTYKNIEIFVIDGGSKDETPAILRSYAEKDSRVRYILNEYQSIKETRNQLFHEAKGEYLTFLDSDDIYLPGKVEKEVQYLESHPENAAVYCDLRYFFDGKPDVLYRHRYTFYSGDIFEHLLDKMFITNTALMLRRSVVEEIGGYDEKLGMVEDWDFFLKMAFRGYRFGFLKDDLVRYRLRWDNSTRFDNQVPIQESAVRIFENLNGQMTPEQRAHYRMNERLARRSARYALALFVVGRKAEGRAALKKYSTGFFRFAAVALGAVLSIIPSSLLRFAAERGWNTKKKNLFIPEK
jgi:teichuronic acid biosynthesis glycosyltransferase TuaG